MVSRYARFLEAEVAPYLRSPSKKPVWVQVRELRALWGRYNFPPYHYFKHRLYERGSHTDVLDYVPPEVIGRFQRHSNPHEHLQIVSDKLETNRILATHGLPCVATLFFVTRSGTVKDAIGREVSVEAAVESLHLRGGEIFIKPVDSGAGKGAFASAAAKVDCELLGAARNAVVQPLLRNHPILDRLFAGSLNTVRIDTLIDGDVCIINAACLKVGNGDAQVDNWARGAIAIGVNLRNGALAPIGIRKAAYGRTVHETHPDTGVCFQGVELPWWPEVCDLACRAALALRPHVTLGWDIAITPEGPVVIEANETGDVFLLQEACGPLGKTRLAQKAIEHWNCRKG